MAETKSKKKAAKPKTTETAAPSKPKKEKAPKEDLVVFAFRLTEAERDAIHKTAGPANASRCVRAIAAAFAAEDDAAFKAVVADAKKFRA